VGVVVAGLWIQGRAGRVASDTRTTVCSLYSKMQFKWQLANAPKYAIAFDGSHWIIIDANESKDSGSDSGFGQQTRSFDWQLAYTHFATRAHTLVVKIMGTWPWH